MIHVFHFAADFPNQDLYPSLMASVARPAELFQIVLSAVRTAAEAGKTLAPVVGMATSFGTSCTVFTDPAKVQYLHFILALTTCFSRHE